MEGIMIFFFNWKEVYIGFFLEELSNVRQCLASNHIKYDYRVVSHSSRSRGRCGSLGIDMNYDKQYYVYVKRKDYERAKYLVDTALHRS
jgi:hypothetical protein